MKLINLKVEYFGPFETEEIDFSSLNNKLFLISGRTGSGKTMIFDAIVYALYGSASTTGRDEESLRSQFAPADKQAQVKLTFEVRGKQYTVERTLKYHKPGNKSATPPKAVLYDSENNILAGKLNEVRDAVEDIVKLNRAQFRKILILPQGEFKELLVSSSTDKQEILRTLFQTGRFLNFELNLKEKLKEQSAEASKLDMRINERVKHIHTEDIDITEQQEFPNYNIVLEYADGVIFSYEKKLEELTETGKKLKEAYQEKQSVLQKKTQHNEQVDKLNALTESQSVLNAQAGSIEQWRSDIATFESVSTIKYELLRHKELGASADEINNSLSKERELEQSLSEKLKNSQTELEETERNIPDMNKRQQQYYSRESFLSTEYETLTDDIESLSSELEQKSADGEKLKESITETKASLGKLTATRSEAAELQEEHSELRDQCKDLENDVEAAHSDKKLLNERSDIKNKIQANNETIAGLKEEVKLFNSNLAHYDEETVQTLNHLINHLELGTACPVCEQTVLELPESGGFSEEDRVRLNALQEQLAEHEEENQKHVIRIDVIDELLKDKEPQDPAALETELEKLNEQKAAVSLKLEKANKELEEKERLNTELTKQNETVHSLELKHQELKSTAAGLADKQQNFKDVTGFTDYSDFKVHMNNEREFIKEFQNNLNVLKEKVTDLTKQHELCAAKVKSLEADYNKTMDSKIQFSTAIDSFMRKNEFTSESVLHDIINDESISAKKDKVKSHDDENLSLTNNIKELKSSLESVEKFSVDEDKAAVSAAEAELEAAREYYAAVKERMNQNVSSRAYLSKLIDTFNASYEEFSKLNELVEAVQGKKGQKVSLERYVLTYYLERILELANVRLTAMTNHRYKLQRSMKKVNRYSGLDIEVFDFYNNQARNINSLSGGETFQASLVLALALNEALQQESGGITLDTMLIDEGFGTLDHETLEVAISTLIDLQTTGKTIGIISHVEELKERMEHILYVKPENERSTTEIVTL
ncbi:Nuclease SbcCD subunit C [Jeotgalicoccus saudimassiliensis]|uniref:Nuclease SbcCD subunit C n=1 Tax=Jeotgalicoccus saudimassiliensis TaxID=1461582 RepID=A0A078M0S4_9STAP|nr:SMC family ATPase [Jeotgalicoccus saudimassiliensis]CDZ99780.1 Nuclease SbcCD subunit C [Jeotgalicoccus saudimassiliensis]